MSFISFWGKKFFLYHSISYSVSHIYSRYRIHGVCFVVVVIIIVAIVYTSSSSRKMDEFIFNWTCTHIIYFFISLFFPFPRRIFVKILSLSETFFLIYLLFNFFPSLPERNCIKWPGAGCKGPEGLLFQSLRDWSRARELCVGRGEVVVYHMYKYLLWSGKKLFPTLPQIFHTFSFAFSSFSFRLMILQLIKHAYIYIVSRWIRIKSQNE